MASLKLTLHVTSHNLANMFIKKKVKWIYLCSLNDTNTLGKQHHHKCDKQVYSNLTACMSVYPSFQGIHDIINNSQCTNTLWIVLQTITGAMLLWCKYISV